MAKYFTIRLVEFHEPQVSEKKKPEREMSCHVTLTSVFFSILTNTIVKIFSIEWIILIA